MKWMYKILISFSLLFFILSIVFYFRDLAYIKSARVYSARIVKLDPVSGNNTLYIIVQFKDDNGIEHEMRSRHSQSFTPFEQEKILKEELSVLYRNGDDYFIQNAFPFKWFGAFAFGVLSLMSLVSIGAYYIIIKIKNSFDLNSRK